jgi:hypothetical protein
VRIEEWGTTRGWDYNSAVAFADGGEVVLSTA